MERVVFYAKSLLLQRNEFYAMTDFEDFIREHREDDVRELALKANSYADVDMSKALVQIDGWQRARRKLPLWASTDGIVYPVHLSMEQCSSEITARYKASIVEGGERVADLTAGFGVDATVLASRYVHLTYVERNEELCHIARNNLPLLGVDSVDVICGEAEDVLGSLPRQDLIFLDPARRDMHGGKVVSIADCTPNVCLLQKLLVGKADTVLIKLSPMIDLSCVERELGCVQEIHVVSVENECKEVLVKMSAADKCDMRMICVNLVEGKEAMVFSFTRGEEALARCNYAEVVESYLYEPNASIMKAGCFKRIAEWFGISKLHPNSHLYTSDSYVADFPGRAFRVLGIYSPKSKKREGIGVAQANISVRNFPVSVADLRKRLKLREGGDDYIFATTLADGRRVLLLCKKV